MTENSKWLDIFWQLLRKIPEYPPTQAQIEMGKINPLEEELNRIIGIICYISQLEKEILGLCGDEQKRDRCL